MILGKDVKFLKRGCGCRNGFCGACATIYRMKGQNQLQTCLACSKKVEDGMFIATLPFFPVQVLRITRT